MTGLALVVVAGGLVAALLLVVLAARAVQARRRRDAVRDDDLLVTLDALGAVTAETRRGTPFDPAPPRRRRPHDHRHR